jgi:hypothetical protein
MPCPANQTACLCDRLDGSVKHTPSYGVCAAAGASYDCELVHNSLENSRFLCQPVAVTCYVKVDRRWALRKRLPDQQGVTGVIFHEKYFRGVGMVVQAPRLDAQVLGAEIRKQLSARVPAFK